MKPVFEKIPLCNTSFVFKDEYFPYYNTFWHSHPEFEIAYLVNGQGNILVGDGIESMQMNDITLFGPNLPHSWYSEDISTSQKEDVRQIIIQFPENLLGTDWLEISEFVHFNELFARAGYGIRFSGKTRDRIIERIMLMLQCNEMERMLELLRIIDIMACSAECVTLSKANFSDKINEKDSSKINKVFQYIQQNFKCQITMEDVAEVASMNPSAFSRYFKRRTYKTFKEFLNEVRISHACKLLMENHLSITQICYESGYNNISNFNRQFKKITSVQPLEYKRLFFSK